MLIYLIKSSVCLALLLLVYRLFLEKEKMHQFNRFYLLGSLLFSIFTPTFVLFNETTEVLTPLIASIQNTTFPVFIESLNPTELNLEKSINYIKLVIFLYITIGGLLLFRFGKNLYQLFKKIQTNKNYFYKNATLVLIPESIIPYTFLHFIFLNTKDYNSNNIEDELFTHELTHVNQKHSLDILFIEFLQIIFWINPLFLYLKRAIKLNHEFIADNQVIHSHKNIVEYQHLLVNKVSQNSHNYLTSSFNYSQTKKRLLMMTKRSSHLKIVLKQLAVIPILIGFTFIFSNKSIAKKNSAAFNNQTGQQEIVIGYKLSLVKKSPVYAGFENLTSQFEIRRALSKSFTKHFKDNFNFILTKKLLNKENKGVISIHFNIDKNGNISSIFSYPFGKGELNPKIQNEIMRVLNLIPLLKPGIRKGKPVDVSYSIRLDFREDNVKIKSGPGPY